MTSFLGAIHCTLAMTGTCRHTCTPAVTTPACCVRCCRCFDWGTVGWLLRTKQVDTQRYKSFVFLNSSVRGPFLPAYWPVGSD